jgi:uncharacterized protein
MTRAWTQTISGRALTISKPTQREIDVLFDMPEHLARIARWNGGVIAGGYSVGQHCCHIADAILDETGDAGLAAVGLLHDAHEFIVGDITTPQAQGFDEIGAELGMGSNAFTAIIAEAKLRADQAIFAACGVPFPISEYHRRVVKSYDIRMCATEMRQLLPPSVKRWTATYERADPIHMRGALKIWPIARAADEFRDRLRALCPAVNRRANA